MVSAIHLNAPFVEVEYGNGSNVLDPPRHGWVVQNDAGKVTEAAADGRPGL